jgi:hypothetical protein
MSLEVLLHSPYVRLTHDAERGLVRFERTSVPFESVASYDASLDRVLDALSRIDRPRSTVLVDMRLGPIRSGDDFEASALRFRREIFRDFARAAVLVSTQIGQLQVNRHAKEQGGAGPRTFRNEGEALRYLLSG